MAGCRNSKYSLDELRRFNDRIENVLNHEACRKEFRQFLRDIRRNDLVNILEIWELANDIKKNTPGSPERRRKFEELEEKLDEEPDFSSILDDVDKIIAANQRASERLEIYHNHYMHYLNKKYR